MNNERNRTIERKIMRFMHNRARPMYLGEISTEIGHSLERTCSFLEAMEDDRTVRRLTNEEKASLGLDARADMWMILVGRRLDDDVI